MLITIANFQMTVIEVIFDCLSNCMCYQGWCYLSFRIIQVASALLMFITLSGAAETTCSTQCSCSPSPQFPGLLSVDCSKRSLISIPNDLPLNTAHLNLFFNDLKEIPADAFAKIPNLRTLNLINAGVNKIHANAFRGCAKLTYLNLLLNPIIMLDEDAFAGLESLRELEISKTHLSSLPTGLFRDLSSLTTLKLNDNKLQEIQDGLLQPLLTLSYLKLSGNELTEIREGTFKNLYSLNTIYFNGNKISKIHPKSFHATPSLVLLDFSYNHIRHLHPDTFSKLTSYHHVIYLTYLRQLECNCDTTEAILKIQKIQVLMGSCHGDGSNIQLRKLRLKGKWLHSSKYRWV